MQFNNEEFAANLRAQRARVDMTQGELAEKVGLTTGIICRYEDGSTTPGADKVFSIAEVLRCTPNDLLGWK